MSLNTSAKITVHRERHWGLSQALLTVEETHVWGDAGPGMTLLLVPIHETASYFHQPLLPLQRKQLQSGGCGVGVWSALRKVGPLQVHGPSCIPRANWDCELSQSCFISRPSQSTALGINSRLCSRNAFLFKATPVRPPVSSLYPGGAWSLAAGCSGVGGLAFPQCVWGSQLLWFPQVQEAAYVLGVVSVGCWPFNGSGGMAPVYSCYLKNQVLDVIALFWAWSRCPFLQEQGP